MNTHYATQLPPEWQPIADVFAALGDENRQKILLLFEEDEELSIKDIVDVMPLSRTATVHHLHALKNAGIVQCRRVGKSVVYRLIPQVLLHAMKMLEEYVRLTHPASVK